MIERYPYEPFEGESALLADIMDRCGEMERFNAGAFVELSADDPLIRTERFAVEADDGQGGTTGSMEEGRIWSDAIRRCLQLHKRVYIPYVAKPIYIDEPIVMRSHYSLKVHPATEIRLKPHTNTCMLRNESIVNGADGPPDRSAPPDTSIAVEGGIWSTLAVGKRGGNGNHRGRVDAEDSIPGNHGVFSFHHAERIAVRHVVMKDCAAFGIHLGNASVFLIDDIRFIRHRYDGVHLDGPLSYGIIRRISGQTGDDVVALNAWDWRLSAVTFGTIEKVLVEEVAGLAGDMWAEIRLLPGVKRFASGEETVCDVRGVILRHIRDIHTFKMYDQPNNDFDGSQDESPRIGHMDEIYFSDIGFAPFDRAVYYCDKDAAIEVNADVQRMALNRIDCAGISRDSVHFGNSRLVAVGPMSATRTTVRNGVEVTRELFRPDVDCTVGQLDLRDVRLAPDVTLGEMLIERQRPATGPDGSRSGGAGRLEAWRIR